MFNIYSWYNLGLYDKADLIYWENHNDQIMYYWSNVLLISTKWEYLVRSGTNYLMTSNYLITLTR